ncbi:hypothetical protein D3C76_134640 [compost metagenome]
MTTPNIGLTELSNSQSQYLNANETFAILDALLGKVVKDKDLNAPPGSPDNGDVYIVGTSPTGLWEGKAKNIAFWSGSAGAWVFVLPKEGWKFEPVDEDQVYRYDGTNWVAFAGGGLANPMTTAGDLIIGGESGAASRLGIGSPGQVLTNISGLPAWSDQSASSGLSLVSKSANYTLQLADANNGILHPSADTTARTFTLPANASVLFPIGTAITFINQNGAGSITIAITTDTLRLAGDGSTGSRTLAANGMATALKLTTTEWIIAGVGLT